MVPCGTSFYKYWRSHIDLQDKRINHVYKKTLSERVCSLTSPLNLTGYDSVLCVCRDCYNQAPLFCVCFFWSSVMRLLALILLFIFAFPVAAKSLAGSIGLFVYPAKDQDKQQREQDDNQCYA